MQSDDPLIQGTPNNGSASWLETLLDEYRGCTKPSCTTCGAMEFRRLYWAEAARHTGVLTADIESSRYHGALLKRLRSSDRDATVRALVAGLRQLSSKWGYSDALRTIILDLYPPLVMHGVQMNLTSELSGTPAGDCLARMLKHAESLKAERARREAFQSPEAAQERKRTQREAKAQAHAFRLSEKRKRNTQRLRLIAELARLSVAERLLRFAEDETLNLDCVAPDLIPGEETEFVKMEEATAVALIARIDRRRGKWGRLRRMLERRF